MRVKNLVGQKFNLLTVICRADIPTTIKFDTAAFWKCKCDCGNETIVRGNSLRVGKIKSCGCLKLAAPQLQKYCKPKYSAKIASAKIAWRRRYTDLPFEYFYNLSQQNCFYCGAEPNLYTKSIRKDREKFCFNTLDRIDSTLGHIEGNVVACCLICNRAKLTRTVSEFESYIDQLYNHKKIDFAEHRRKVINRFNYVEKGIRIIKSLYDTTYSDGDLTFEQFYNFIYNDCYYCGSGRMNKKLLSNGDIFYYNGIDRIDNNKKHNYENSVTCCKYCNSAKGNLSFDEFILWSERVYKKKGGIIIPPSISL